MNHNIQMIIAENTNTAIAIIIRFLHFVGSPPLGLVGKGNLIIKRKFDHAFRNFPNCVMDRGSSVIIILLSLAFSIVLYHTVINELGLGSGLRTNNPIEFLFTGESTPPPSDSPPPDPLITYVQSPHLTVIENLYLDTLRDTILGISFPNFERKVPYDVGPNWQSLSFSSLSIVDKSEREAGKDWPLIGITMVGKKRLDNIREIIEASNREGLIGAFMECGVWRGGASIFAKAVINVYAYRTGTLPRQVWLADSFDGLPLPRNPKESKDEDYWHKLEYLRVSLDEVKRNFEAYRLLDDQVHFCKGYHVDTLPTCHPEKIAILRMDSDMYESTLDQLFNLYPLITVGGYIIVDDWSVLACQRALKDFWRWHDLDPTIFSIDDTSIYWRKSKEVTLKRELYDKLLVTSIITSQPLNIIDYNPVIDNPNKVKI